MSLESAINRTLQFLGSRKRYYQLEIGDPSKSFVLKDLRTYAHMNEDCPHTDPFTIGKWLGRQEVVRRIERHLYLTPEELFAIYSGVRTQTKE